MAPKGLPKSGALGLWQRLWKDHCFQPLPKAFRSLARWDFGEGGLDSGNQLSTQAGLLALAVAPWMGVNGSIQMPRAEKKVPKKPWVLRWFTVVYKIPLL